VSRVDLRTRAGVARRAGQDPARYEERYRPTGAALGLASALLALGLGFLWHTQLIFAALTVLLAIPAMLAIARRPVAFRADHAGITLGSDRQLPRRPAVFIPWADAEKIILYPGHTSSGDQAQYVGVQRREGAPPPYGNEQVPWCPVPGVAAGAARRIKSWRLDREQSWPPSPPQWRRESPSSTPGTTPTGALKDRANARTSHRMACEPS
jgi:hypothetical protein